MSRKEKIVLTILLLIIAFVDISGLPGVLFPISFFDVDPFIIPIIINFIFIGLLSILVIKIFKIKYDFKFLKDGLIPGLKRFALPGIIAGVLSCIAFMLGLMPFDYQPTLWKILIEGIIYYIGVGIVQEFYVRGLFLNLVEELSIKNKHKTEIAILVSSVIFGLGHIPGVLSMGPGVILFKAISTIGMGMYFGFVYKKTNNLWVPIIMHTFIDICALPYCFTQNMRYEPVSIVVLLITYIGLAVYCSFILFSKKKKTSTTRTI